MSYIRSVRCRNCGAPKVTRSSSAYIYCDYCATYTDFDYRIAFSNPIQNPGQQYHALLISLHPKLEEARIQNDRSCFAAHQRELHSLHLEACPLSYSPRIRNEAYRSALLHYLAESATLMQFDDETRRLDEEMARATKVLRYTGTKARSDTFWRVFELYRRQCERVLKLCHEGGLFYNHPDELTSALAKQQGFSLFVQGWINHLEDDDADLLLKETALSGEYVRLEPPETTEGRCETCGAELQVVHGAQSTLCESCGSINNFQLKQFDCRECGACLRPVADSTVIQCPFCGAQSTLF